MNARQQIVDAIVARLKTLTVANGYASNAGATVYSHFPENLQVESLPMIDVADDSDAITVGGAKTEHRLSVTITGLMEYGTTTATALRELESDIVRALMTPTDKTLGGVCSGFDVTTGGSIQLEQRTDKTVGSVSLSLIVTYQTSRSDWRDNA